MQFNLQVLGDVLKISQAIIQMEIISINSKGDDSRKEIIHISYSHNNSILKVLWRCLRFNHTELNIKKS